MERNNNNVEPNNNNKTIEFRQGNIATQVSELNQKNKPKNYATAAHTVLDFMGTKTTNKQRNGAIIEKNSRENSYDERYINENDVLFNGNEMVCFLIF